MIHRSFVSVVVAAFTSASCAPAPGHIPGDLPALTLRAGAQARKGSMYTFCWYSATPPCHDGFLAAAAEPLVVDRNVTLLVSAESEFGLMKLHYEVVPLLNTKVRSAAGVPGLMIWEPPYATPTLAGDLPPISHQKFGLVLEPGDYVLKIDGDWGGNADGGSTVTGFWLRVQP